MRTKLPRALAATLVISILLVAPSAWAAGAADAPGFDAWGMVSRWAQQALSLFTLAPHAVGAAASQPTQGQTTDSPAALAPGDGTSSLLSTAAPDEGDTAPDWDPDG